MNAQEVIGYVNGRYQKRIFDVINAVAAQFIKDGWIMLGGIQDMTDTEYTYRQMMRHPQRSDPKVAAPAGIQFEIVEAVQFDGAPADGINFRLNIGDEQRHEIDIQPHNFTPQVWVHARDAKAVEARFREIESIDFTGIIRVFYH